MKTTQYSKPKIVIIEIEAEGVIAYSGGGSTNIEDTDDTSTGGAVYSKRRGFWGGEE